MDPGRRYYLEKMIADWSPKAAARRRAGTRRDLNIAGVLEHAIAEYRAELDAASAPIVIEAVTWASAMFNRDGRFNPFAGTYAEQMLASAAACERMGYGAAAVAYRAHAARGRPPDDDGQPDRLECQSTTPIRKPARPIWTGPNLPPPEPTAFTAGPQLGLFA